MVKNLTANAGDSGSVPGSVRPPGRGNGNLFQYSCLENSMDGGTWRVAVHGVTESNRLTTHAQRFIILGAARIKCICLCAGNQV